MKRHLAITGLFHAGGIGSVLLHRCRIKRSGQNLAETETCLEVCPDSASAMLAGIDRQAAFILRNP